MYFQNTTSASEGSLLTEAINWHVHTAQNILIIVVSSHLWVQTLAQASTIWRNLIWMIWLPIHLMLILGKGAGIAIS
jgi:hypothetical protein